MHTLRPKKLPEQNDTEFERFELDDESYKALEQTKYLTCMFVIMLIFCVAGNCLVTRGV